MDRLVEAEAEYSSAERLAPPNSRAQLDYTNARVEVQVKQLQGMGFPATMARAAVLNHHSVTAAAAALKLLPISPLTLSREVLDSDDEEELYPRLNNPGSTSNPASFTSFLNNKPKPLVASQPTRTGTPPSMSTTTTTSSTTSIVPGDPLTDARNPLRCDTLWVGNLKEPTTEAELRSKFQTYGRIRSLALMLEKHCGFVSYQDWRSAAAAMSEQQNKPMHGHAMFLKYPDRALNQGPQLKNLVLRKKH